MTGESRWTAFSLNQTKGAEGGTDVWDDASMASARMAAEVAIAVRDGWPDAFSAVHWDLFAARHDHGLDILDDDVVAKVLVSHGLDPDEIFKAVLSGVPRETFRVEHEAAVKDQVFGVPTVIAGGQAVFIRLMDRPEGTNASVARQTVERCLDLVIGWPNLNEFKHTSIPR